MTPQLYRTLVGPDRAVAIVGSDNYKRRVSIMYKRYLLNDNWNDYPVLYVYTTNNVQNGFGGNGIEVLPAMQFQVELDRKDYLWAIASENVGELSQGALEVSIIIEALDADAPVETYRLGGESR